MPSIAISCSHPAPRGGTAAGIAMLGRMKEMDWLAQGKLEMEYSKFVSIFV
jgi:hypothetical protein